MIDAEVVDATREWVKHELVEQHQRDGQLLSSQRRRWEKLERQRQRRIDAFVAEAIPAADLKIRQQAIPAEQREAERLIELASTKHEHFEQRLRSRAGTTGALPAAVRR